MTDERPEPDPTPPELDTGVAGASARREHARRKASREKRVRAKHPRIGGALLALRDDPTHETVWARGAGGEEHVAAMLTRFCKSTVVVLHDRKVPKSRANLDHIAISANGVWVIDTKRYQGKATVHAPLFGKAKLIVNGRDQTRLIHSLGKQVTLVKGATNDLEVPVHGALCFVDTDLPLLRKLTLNGYPICHPRPLAKRLNAPGPLSGREREIAVAIAALFPPA